ncbi:MAG: queuosine precursor transporter [Parachlamydiales bacterium]|jgi:hypothetical protein
MNEFIFIIHILLVVIFLLLALRLGKNYLLALVCLQAIIANLFVVKQIDLFSRIVTPTDVFIIGTFLGENLLQEYFGKEEANKAIKISFFSMIFFLVMSKIQILYQPSAFDTMHSSFKNILSNSPRIIVSSILVFFFVQKFDLIFFGFLKKIFNEKHFVFRLTISALLMQLLDTVLFTFLALKGIASSLFDIILFSFIIKATVILLTTPFMRFSKKMVKASNE